MDIATAIGIGKKVAKVAKKAKELYELDQKRRVRVNEDVVLGRFRDDITFPDGSVRSVPDFRCDDFAIEDGVFTVFATGDRDPFCDGSSLAPDRIGSWDTIKAALGHDAGYEHLEEIAKAWGWTVDEVRWLFDAMFGDLLLDEAARQKSAVMRTAGGVFSRIYYWAVRNFGGIYHRAKSGAVVCVAALVLAGCVSIPGVFDPSGEQPDYTILGPSGGFGSQPGPTATGAADASDPPAAATPEKPATSPSAAPANHHNDETGFEKPSGTGVSGVADAVDFSSLDWCWGNFKAGGAQLVDGCRIGSLRVTSSGLSYAWEQGGCERLGASSRKDYSQTLACLFVRIGGKWQGGKVDWISTSRTTRDHKNIREGYAGWRKDAIEAADAFAFVIVSKDGKKRSNVISTGGTK